MEFKIEELGEDNRTVTVAAEEGMADMALTVTVEVNSYAVYLNRAQALALSGALRAMARTLTQA